MLHVTSRRRNIARVQFRGGDIRLESQAKMVAGREENLFKTNDLDILEYRLSSLGKKEVWTTHFKPCGENNLSCHLRFLVFMGLRSSSTSAGDIDYMFRSSRAILDIVRSATIR